MQGASGTKGLDSHLNSVFYTPDSDAPIVFLLDGEGEGEIAGGPITEAGYYVKRPCTPMCCRPFGPYQTRPEARRAMWAYAAREVLEEARPVPRWPGRPPS
jgi:hypothetical protein